jgi:hypothetical protein
VASNKVRRPDPGGFASQLIEVVCVRWSSCMQENERISHGNGFS